MSDRLHLDHILSRIQRIARYTSDGPEAFLDDDKTAVLRSLQTLAESTQRLSDEVKQRYPEIDWRAIAGFRNVVVHNDLGLDPMQVWRVVEDDLPRLAATITRILSDLGDPS